MSLHVWQDTTKTDWVIAEDSEDASKAWAETMGEEFDSSDGWVQWLDDGPLRMRDEDGEWHEKTCAEWVKEYGRGMLCSTEY